MAKSLVTEDGTIFKPGAYSRYRVQSNPGGLATTGVLMLIGEADAGPDFTEESDLEETAQFGPDQSGDVRAKYGSGPLVDAFLAAVQAANDPNITGSFASAILVKTNVSARASGSLPKIGGGSYASLLAKSQGKAGNQILFQTVSSQAESLPTTGAFTFIPAVGTVAYGIRISGGADVGAGTLAANAQPPAVQAALDGISGLACSGGSNRNILTVSGTLLLDANPLANPGTNNVVVTRSVAWAATPVVGDTMVIPTGSVLAGGADQNVGAYVVTAVTSTSISATKLSDAGNGAAVIGTITAPVDVSPAVSAAAVTDVIAYAPLTVTLEAGAVIDGVGKSLEIAELATGTDLLSRTAFGLGTVTAVTWVSKSGTPKLLSAAAEYKVKLNLSRSSDGVSEEFIAGGDIGLKLSYLGTTATVTITDTALTTSVAGGSGSNLSIDLSDYTNIGDLAAFINSQTGYSCSPGNTALGLLPVSALDNVSAKPIASTWGAANGRIKMDAYRFYQAVAGGSFLAQVNDPAEQAGSGLPDVMASALFMSGGTRGSTSDADVTAGLAALETVQGNFLVPLFSRDATSDIADALTDSGSTYTIASIHAAARAHVTTMSTLKRRRNRQAWLSIAASFQDSQDAAANIASVRCGMAFQDFKNTAASGSLTQFLPWMGAVLGAGMQAAGFYRNIEGKGIGTSGVLSRAGDFNPKSDSQVESALKAGLMPAEKADGGGYTWISDQTTYGRDDNFVFNSMQAVYAADTVARTTAVRMEKAFKGQSPADIGAPVALSFLEGILGDMLRLKLIAPSDDAPKGFKNATVQIRGNAMYVSVEIKLATAIDFILIDFLVAPVVQTA